MSNEGYLFYVTYVSIPPYAMTLTHTVAYNGKFLPLQSCKPVQQIIQQEI